MGENDVDWDEAMADESIELEELLEQEEVMVR